jgi:hypothetical protein
MPATLFYDASKGWIVSYRTASGFRHDRVASRSASRPTDDELRAKGYEV